jgi:hypothetical protein
MSRNTQHASLSIEAWARHSLGQQLLMIASEMNRASKLLGAEDRQRLLSAYERVLALVDLTVSVSTRRAVRREMLRWLHPETWRQLPYVTGVQR